jgi:transposase InsO family protein
MNAIQDFLQDIRNSFLLARQALGYMGTFLWALVVPRARLAARLIAAESQLAIHTHRIQQKKEPRPRFTPGFRFLWVCLSLLWDQWRDGAHLMQPATVIKWHRTAFRLYWRWKSRSKPGRPPISQEMMNLIRRLSRENPLWSPERIRDTLALLGYDPPHEDTIRKYMVLSRNPKDRSTTWLPFLRNHLHVSWAIDFFTVVTANFAFLYVFVVFAHGQRRVLHFATTYNPSMEWIIQQLREAMPFGKQPRFMFRDNDRKYGHGVKAFLESCGIEEVKTAYRSPWQNPFIERFVGTLRRELMDHVVVWSESHLRRLLREFINEYYHVARPHQGLDGDTPIASEKPKLIEGPSRLIAFPVCGGLHHRYERVAA